MNKLEDFLDSFNFINKLPLSYLHVFTYSERDNTEAALMTDIVPMNIRNNRTKQLRNLSEKKRHAFYSEHEHSVRSVLFESKNENGMMEGFTDNYIKVEHAFSESLSNSIQQVQLINQTDHHMQCSLIKTSQPKSNTAIHVS